MIMLLKKYWLSILAILIIFVLCFINTAAFVQLPPVRNFDKFVHFILFLGLSGVIFFDNTSYLRYSISKVRISLGSFYIPTAIGGLIEIMQSVLTRSRTGDWFDFLCDGIGAIIGMGIALIINRYLKSK